jgi:hypothetical protein
MLLAAVLAAVLAIPLATSAQAKTSTSVPIPLHPVAISLTLLGASTRGVVIQQGSVQAASGQQGGDDDGTMISPVLTGAEGTQLTVRPQFDSTVTDVHPGTVVAVVGDTVAWYKRIQQAGSQPQQAHLMNVRTGADVSDGVFVVPNIFNGDSWFSDAVVSFNSFPFEWPVRRFRSGTASGPGDSPVTDTLIPYAHSSGVAMAADRRELVYATMDAATPAHYYLDLVDLKTGLLQRLLDTTDVISAVALGPGTVVWASKPAAAAVQINQRPRDGGATVSYSETDGHADVTHLVAGAAGIAYLVPDPAGAFLRVVDGATAHRVDLPLGGAGLAAACRFGSAPSPASKPGFSAESLLTDSTGPISFSAARGAVRAEASNQWRFLDRGVVTALIEAPASATPNVSGPYTLIAGKVYRPDGELIYTEPLDQGASRGWDDVFGSQVIFSRLTADDASEIWLDDAERPAPVRLDTLAGCAAAATVAVWGETVAWARSCGTGDGSGSGSGRDGDSGITVMNLRSGATRSVPTDRLDLSRMQLSEGTLTWNDGRDRILT